MNEGVRGEEQPTSAPETVAEAFRSAVQRSGFAKVAPGSSPTASSLLAALGGVRGLIEALLPGLMFLVVYAITKELIPSVVVPVIVALGFVAIRLLTRANAMGAFAGVLGIALSAGMALITGRAEDNFVLGFGVNALAILLLGISLAVRRPLIGLIVGLLGNELASWRTDRARVRVAVVATVMWIGVFSLRLSVQVPLYLAELPEALAATKLIMGVPLYAAALWVTWLLVRAVHNDTSPRAGDSA